MGEERRCGIIGGHVFLEISLEHSPDFNPPGEQGGTENSSRMLYGNTNH